MNESGRVRNGKMIGRDVFDKFFAFLMLSAALFGVWQTMSFAFSYIRLAW